MQHEVDDALREGHYAKKQIFCRSKLISWSHSRRFVTGVRLAERFAGKRIVDYGCGDGTFLTMLMAGQSAPAFAVGAELTEDLVRDCRERLESERLQFVLTSQLHDERHRGAYDGVVCMEVLEHVIDDRPMLELFHSLLAPGGSLLLSVPVETGLPVLVKQSARRLASWRKFADYSGMQPYTMRELWATVFAGSQQHIVRPVHSDENGFESHDHKGFNWMFLREKLRDLFEIEQVLGSPLAWLPPHLGSQAWFIARKREEFRKPTISRDALTMY